MGLVSILTSALQGLLTLISWVFVPLERFIFSCIYDRHALKVPAVKNELCLKSAIELADLIRSRKVKAIDVMEAFIARTKEVDCYVNAVVANRFHDAIREAQQVDKLLDGGDLGEEYSKENTPLLGVPLSVKEAFALKGMPNASGLVTRKNKRSTTDAAVVARLKKAGAIPFIVTNVSELCMWYESANRLYGRTKNAYNNTRIVGGSSGGEGCILSSAAAVIGIGSDIGGSIRMPAFFNGIFGHKPSRGIVPNEGQYPIATGKEVSLLGTGPMCRYAEDILPLFKIFAGQEASKRIHLDEEVDLSTIKIYSMLDDGGSLFVSPVDPQLKEAQKKVENYLKSKGMAVERASLHRMKYSLEVWLAKMNSGGGTKFAQFMADMNGSVNCFLEFFKWMFGCSVHTLPAIGLGLIENFGSKSVDVKFLKVFEKLEKDVANLLGDSGVLLYPSHPKIAPYHNEPILHPFNFAYTGVFNALGLPVTQCPLGLSKEGLPLGIQVVTAMNNDRISIAVARELEKGFHGWVKP